MTTRKPGGDDRIRKPIPARREPIRNLMPKPAAETPAAAPQPADATGEPPWPSAAVAEAVKRGYKVIGENIEQGRTAAAQFRNGQYNVRDASHDLNQLSLRMLSLARELSDTTCEVLERLLRDPKFPGAAPRDPAAPPRSHQPPPFRPAPPPPGGAAAARGVRPPGPLEVVFKGGPAKVLAATLDRPPQATVLAPPVLKALDGAAKDITGVGFGAGEAAALRITVDIPAGQPKGVYSGLLCPEGSPIPLGVLTIEVTG